MKDTRIVSSPAATAVRILLLLLASRNFMPAKALPMPPVVVPPVVQPDAMVSLQCRALHHVVANIMRRPALPVDAQRPCHSFHVKIVQFIVVIASRLNAPPVVVITAMIHAAIAVVAVAVVMVVGVVGIAGIGATTATIDGSILISLADHNPQ
jgi:hypothetical protein